MTLPRNAALCASLILLSSCALDESASPARPDSGIPQPASTQRGDAATAITAPSSRSTHRGSGTQPVLVRNGRLSLLACLRFGLEENLDVDIAEIRTQSAAEEIEIARADFDPNIHGFVGQESLMEGVDYTEAAVAISKKFSPGTVVSLEGRTTSDVLTNSSLNTSYANGFTARRAGNPSSSQVDAFVDSLVEDSVALRVRQPLLRGGGRDVNVAPIALARLSVEAADTARRAQVFEFLRGAETAYWTAAVGRQIHLIESRNLERNRMIVENAKRRVDAGTATNVDYFEAETGLANARKSAIQAERRYEDAIDNLRLILGMPLSGKREDIAFESIEEILPTGADPDPAVSYRKALDSYPDVILLANEVRRNQINLGIAGNNMLPAVDLEFSTRWRSNDQFVEHSGNNDLDWGVLLQFSVPWTLRAEHAELRRAELALLRSETSRQQALRELEKTILAVTRTVSSYKEQLQVASQLTRVTEKKWSELELRFREGLVPVRDLVEAQEETRLAQTRELEARLALVAAMKMLQQLDGSVLEARGFTWS